MAGRGSRPHSLTVPKPLLPVAGTPIVEQLVTEILKVVDTPVDEIAFILGDPAYFDEKTEAQLIAFAHDLGAKEPLPSGGPLGTGHAIMTQPSFRRACRGCLCRYLNSCRHSP